MCVMLMATKIHKPFEQKANVLRVVKNSGSLSGFIAYPERTLHSDGPKQNLAYRKSSSRYSSDPLHMQMCVTKVAIKMHNPFSQGESVQ